MLSRALTMTLALGLVVASWAGPKGDAIISQIEALKQPAYDAAHQDASMKAYAEHTQKVNGLIWQLFLQDPNHPRTAQLMEQRWTQFESGNVGDGEEYARRILADIDKTLAMKPNAEIVEVADYCAASTKLERQLNGNTDPVAVIDGFLKKHAHSPRGERLILSATYQVGGQQQLDLYGKYLAEYPNGKFAPSVKGALRKTSDLGKPFALKFKDAVTGKAFDISEYKGKVILLDFWATWCGPCVAKMPEVKKWQETYGPKGFQVVGISLDQPEGKGGLKALLSYVAKNKIPWPQYYQGNGWQSDFSVSWGILSIPQTFLIDKKGNLRFAAVNDEVAKIEQLLSEK